ncbi:ACH96167.1 61k AcORF9 3-like protein [Kallithea virus]|uniref:ACH96167.1 61k AcORF9 3-like protein n=1 Tax=Kallithea virus TaxID=1654582 RepID=A0A1S5VG06_9VIRU|nr:ACH96167.1 61k AcORF9 3-like protein [Kallithea virus]AQN78583.1 ACH96167.1 61k AcORF9 3-like protein [Kallithea virus]
MDLAALLSRINGNLETMDQCNYNFGIFIGRDFSDTRNNISELRDFSKSNQRMDTSPTSRSNFMIEPVLSQPSDYLYLASLPKNARLDERSLIRSNIPDTVIDTCNKTHNVLIHDAFGSMGVGQDATVLYKRPLVGPEYNSNYTQNDAKRRKLQTDETTLSDISQIQTVSFFKGLCSVLAIGWDVGNKIQKKRGCIF